MTAHWSLEEELQGAQHPTHFGRILQDLAIGYIPAGSPQAKGRIERLWRTLQDRLVVELRLRGLATLEAANAFLPAFLADFNPRFAHPATDPTPAWRRPPPDLANVLSCRYRRTVARDNTVRLGARSAQIPRGPRGRSYAGGHVEARECLDGRLLVYGQGGVLLAMQPWAGPDFVLRPRRAPHPAPSAIPRCLSERVRRGRPPSPYSPKRPSSRPTPSARRAPATRTSRAHAPLAPPLQPPLARRQGPAHLCQDQGMTFSWNS